MSERKRLLCNCSWREPIGKQVWSQGPVLSSSQRRLRMNTTPFNKTGLETLLTPENSALILIDHQPFQFASVNSHDPQTIINNVVGLAKVAKLFKVPTLLTTVTEERGGYLLKQLQDVFPDQKPINRTFINAWEDKRLMG